MIGHVLYFMLPASVSTVTDIIRGVSEVKYDYPCVLRVIKQLTDSRSPSPLEITLVNIDQDLVVELHKAEGVKFLTRTFYWNNIVYNDAYLIQVEDYHELKNGIDVIRKDNYWNPKKQFIIIIERLDDIVAASLVLFKQNIFNVTVIASCGKEYSIYGFNPSLDSCHRPARRTLELISKCSEFVKENTFRYKDLPTMQHCRFAIGTKRQGIDVPKLHDDLGMYQFVLGDFLESHNNTMDLVEYRQVNESALSILDTYNLEGALEFNFNLEQVSPCDFAYPYYTETRRVIVRRARILSVKEARYNQAATRVSLITGVIFTLIIATARRYHSTVVKKKGDWFRELLIVFGMVLQNSDRETYIGLSTRIFAFLLFFYSTMFNTIQVVQLTGIMTNPVRARQVDDINEVLNNYDPAWDYFTRLEMMDISQRGIWPVNLTAQVEKHEKCWSPLECLEKVKKGSKMYTLVTDLYYDSHVWKLEDHCFESPLHRISSTFNNIYDTVVFYPGSTVTKHLSRHMIQMLRSGILRLHYMNITFQGRLKGSKCKELDIRQPLALNNIVFASFPPFVMALLAIACFICEIVIHATRTR